MADLDSSTKRLDAAIARLEAAAEKRGGAGGLAGAEQQRLEKELMKKQKERDELWSSLADPFLKK